MPSNVHAVPASAAPGEDTERMLKLLIARLDSLTGKTVRTVEWTTAEQSVPDMPRADVRPWETRPVPDAGFIRKPDSEREGECEITSENRPESPEEDRVVELLLEIRDALRRAERSALIFQ